MADIAQRKFRDLVAIKTYDSPLFLITPNGRYSSEVHWNELELEEA
jgi:hypothetical protein